MKKIAASINYEVARWSEYTEPNDRLSSNEKYASLNKISALEIQITELRQQVDALHRLVASLQRGPFN
tara:strand:- start:1053 stop:1256 length:204 start_codon:yes stop_codon:yes gene_type:complete